MKGRAITYSDAELFWIHDNHTRPRREAHAEFVHLWDRADVSLSNFNSLCKRRGWMTGRTGCYTPGRTPENKGKTMPYNANSARTRFKTGERRGKAVDLYKPIGSERVSKDGYLERKIHDGLPLQARWRAVHLIRWEAQHGPLPEAHCLKCLDGDKSNTAPENWQAIPRALLPRLNARWSGVKYDDAAPELKPTLLAIAMLEHGARQAKRGSGS